MRSIALSVALSLAMAACGGRPTAAPGAGTPTAIELRLLHANCANSRIEYMQGVDDLEVDVSDGGQHQSVAPADTVAVSLPYGASREVTVLARSGSRSIAWGHAIVRVDAPGQAAVPLLMYPTLQFAPLADIGGECATLLPRAGFAASLMQDGRVLVAGGYLDAASPTTLTRSDLTVSAQVLDPRTGGVTNLPDVCDTTRAGCDPRMRDTALTLDDGRVLVAGGSTLRPGPRANDVVPPVLYDPAANAWTPAPMQVPRRAFTPILLQPAGGAPRKVAAIGGLSAAPDGMPVASAEIFDPAMDSWSVAADRIQAGGKEVLLSGYRVGAIGIGGIDALGRSQAAGFTFVGGSGAPSSSGPGPLSPTVYAFVRQGPELDLQPFNSFDMSVATDSLAVVGLGPDLLILSGSPAATQATTYLWDGVSLILTGTAQAKISGACTVVLDTYNSLIVDESGGTYLATFGDRTRALTVGPIPIPGSTASVRLGQPRKDPVCLRVSDHQVLVLGGYGPSSAGASTFGSAEVFTF